MRERGGEDLSHEILRDATLFAILPKIDADLAETARVAGCECGGVLHRSDFPRKARGGPSGLGAEYAERISFCCNRKGCRGRVTPPSVRFLGRKVYVGAVVVLVSAMRNGPTPRRIAKLRELLGISERTLRRWSAWWGSAFAAGAFWKAVGGRFAPPPPAIDALPHSLLERFGGGARASLVAALRFLCPITTTSARCDMAA